MKTGRKKKPTELLKLQGTYRADRHAENIDEKIECFLDKPESNQLLPPENITDSYVKDIYSYHVNFLNRLKILTISDLPELEMLFLTLQQYREVQKQLANTNITEDLENYERLTKLSVKLGNRFSILASKYYISPTARTRLELDTANLENIKSKNKSSIGSLLAKRNG